MYKVHVYSVSIFFFKLLIVGNYSTRKKKVQFLQFWEILLVILIPYGYPKYLITHLYVGYGSSTGDLWGPVNRALFP
jgi:hypothetical protein